MLDEIIHIPFGDIDALESVLDETVAGVIVEPIQGEGGVVVTDLRLFEVAMVATKAEVCRRIFGLLVEHAAGSVVGSGGPKAFALALFDCR